MDEELFAKMNFCPVCGSNLVFNEEDESMSCPEGDGEAYTTESVNGLPSILFETRD